MPELPEVETIRRVLDAQVKGRFIEKVVIRRPEVAAHPSAPELEERLAGQTVEGTDRRGKFFLLVLTSGDRLIVHLRMTGCLLFAPENLPEEKHTHAVLCFRGGGELRFSDTRRFGRLWLIREGEEDTFSGIGKLGVEPFSPALDGAYLKARFQKSKKPIKECLLDQTAVAGIGNIYSDEILFSGGIAPSKPACSLTEEEWCRLAAVIPERLAYFIEKNRVTAEDYLAGRGREYRDTPFLQVYGRAGQACPVCGGTLEKRAIGGRSSVFCPRCQT